jgi:tRNA-splicing ligase RtcB (3'-phosphate/5'-hydroxy nucleic acid ligase)
VSVKIYGEADGRTIAQIERCQEAEEGSRAVLCADSHLGYSQPIGGVVAYRDHISPSGVGYDIGCGNKAVRTNIRVGEMLGTRPSTTVGQIMDEIVRRVSFGMGRNNDEPVDHPVLDQIKDAPFAPQRQLYDLAAKQLGTVGSGNHYVDLFADEQSYLWVGVHFGSRGFGHKTASGFLALAQGLQFDDHASEGEMDSPPIVFPVDSELGQSYIEAMSLAGAYAYAGRDVVVETVLSILGAFADFEVHNHHNFAWREEHDGEMFWVVRKGATPAFPGQQGFVGSTMAEESVILEGTESAGDALFSTVHGAGRVMSRTEAKGKTKRRKRWECSKCGHDDRDPNRLAKHIFEVHSENLEDASVKEILQGGTPVRGVKRQFEEQVLPGKVDWEAERANIEALGIELRGAAADEAPPAYKRLDEVLAAHGDTIHILHRLRPIGVAMAGPDIYDPFKD